MSNKLIDDTEYDKPKTTITDLVQNRKNILEILEGHEELSQEEVDELPFNTKLKYITYHPTQKQYLFRFGGMLRKKDPRYLVLAGRNNKTFTVQRYNKKGDNFEPTRFYKTVSRYDKLLEEHEELKKQSEIIFDKQETLINTQNTEIKKLRKIIQQLKKSNT